MWDLPRPGLEPVSPALAGGFLTTAPPGKSLKYIDYLEYNFPRSRRSEAMTVTLLLSILVTFDVLNLCICYLRIKNNFKEMNIKNYKINCIYHKIIITIYSAHINSAGDTKHISPHSLLITTLIFRITKFIFKKSHSLNSCS